MDYTLINPKLWLDAMYHTNDPVELATAKVFRHFDIKFTRPDKDGSGNLDFYLPEYQLYVEVKAWSCERLHTQLRASGKERAGIVVLIGIEAVRKFGAMLLDIKVKG